jgi:hypothetical protein
MTNNGNNMSDVGFIRNGEHGQGPGGRRGGRMTAEADCSDDCVSLLLASSGYNRT